MYSISQAEIRRALESTVICLASVNVEISVPMPNGEFEPIIRRFSHSICRGEKVMVRAIETYDIPANSGVPGNGHTGIRVTLPSGEILEFSTTHGKSPVTGGSSANIAYVLRAFDIRDVTIVSAVGEDWYGRHILGTLEQGGFRLLMLPRRSTSTSLVVREPEITTLFACKPPYQLDDDTRRLMAESCNTQVLIASGVRAEDLDLVETLWERCAGRFRVFSPHIDLLLSKNPDDQRRRRILCAGADIVHMNDYEAAALFGLVDQDRYLKFPQEDEAARHVMESYAAPFGAKIFCVTRGARGSITYDHSRRNIIIQPCPENIPNGNTVGAGDIHLASLIYYLRLRGRTLELEGALDVAGRITAKKIMANNPLPWAGIPDSPARKPWVRAHYPKKEE